MEAGGRGVLLPIMTQKTRLMTTVLTSKAVSVPPFHEFY